MRKGLIVLLLVLFLVPSAFGTYTRLATMGYSFLYMEDDYNIWYFPQTAVDYQKHIIAEHPYAGTVVMRLGENDALGIRVSSDYTNYFVIPYDEDAAYYYGFNGDMLFWIINDMASDWEIDMSPQDKFSLVYAHRFDAFRIGFMVNMMGTSLKIEDSELDPTYNAELKTGIINFTGGFSMEVGEEHQLDLAVDYSHASFTWTDDDYDPATVAELDGGNAFGVTARFMYKWNDDVALIPAGSFFSGSIGVKESDSYSKEKDSRTIFNLGLGCNYQPNDNFELITALGVIYNKMNYDYSAGEYIETFSSFDMPYFLMGMDLNVKKWLNFRLGINKWLRSWKYVYDIDAVSGEELGKWSEAPLVYTLGAGIYVGGLEFDCVLNNDFLNEGPYFISGDDVSGDLFPQVSIKYNFK